MRGGLWIFLTVGTLALSGCNAEGTQPTEPKAAAVAAPAAKAKTSKAEAVARVPAANAPSKIEVKRDKFTFIYSWPNIAAEYPLLRDYFQSDARKMQGELEGWFDEDERMKDPNEQYKPTYETELEWTVAGQTDGMISISGAWYSYTGGAHGMHGVRSLSYDKGNDTILQANEVIADTDAFVGATQDVFCRLLDAERVTRRGEAVMRDEMFGECVPLLNQTLIWKSAGGSKFDRMEVFIGPYEAGPYAEGAYVLNLPITAPMVAAIAPQYRDNFAVSASNGYSVEDK